MSPDTQAAEPQAQAPQAPTQTAPAPTSTHTAPFPDVNDALMAFLDDGAAGDAAKDAGAPTTETRASRPDASPPAPAKASDDPAGDEPGEGPDDPTEATPEPGTPGQPLGRTAKIEARVRSEYEPKLAEMAQKLADLESQVRQANGQLTEAEQREQSLRTSQAAADKAAAEAVGPDDEYERLTRMNNLGQALTPEQYDSLSRWTQARELRDPFVRQANAIADQRAQARIEESERSLTARQRLFDQHIANRAAAVSEKLGLPKDLWAENDDFGVIVERSYEAGAASQDARIAELETQVSRLEAGVVVAATKAAAAPALPMGGRSGAAGANASGAVFDPTRSVSENLDAFLGSGGHG